jgi:surfactin synthase thioesterase subunit
VTEQRPIKPESDSGFVLLAPQPTLPAARTLVCFHYAGGSAQAFYPWRAECASRCTLVAAELPGRGRRPRAPLIGSIVEAAEGFALSYARMPRTEVVFFGHSLGALVAFETVRAIERMRLPGPERLIVSCRAAPGSGQSLASLPDLSDAALVKYLENLEGTPEAVLKSEALMKFALPVLRADLKLIYDYKFSPTPKLNIPIDVIGTIEDKWAPIEVLLEWRRVTHAEFCLRMIPGGHFAPISSPSLILDLLGSDRGGAKVGARRTSLSAPLC